MPPLRTSIFKILLSWLLIGIPGVTGKLYARGPVSHSDWVNPPVKSIVGTIISIDRDAKMIGVEFGQGDQKRTIHLSAASDHPVIQVDDDNVEFSSLQTGMSTRVKYRGNVALEIHARCGDSDNKK